MSQDEDVELKDLVTEALEKNGVLAKIRAQLRANIFMTLENENGQKHQNPRLKSVLSSRDGVLSLILVQELVEFCNLIQTSSVFKAETGQGKAYVYEGRQPLLDNFKLDKESVKSDLPVLILLIKLLFKLLKTSQANSAPTNNVDTSNERSYNESEGSPNPGAQNNTFLINSGRSDNYDLSFVSDSESSVDDKNRVIPLNLNNSSESNESLSTEIAGNQLSKDDESFKSEESSIKPDESIHEHSESSKIMTDNPSESPEDQSPRTETPRSESEKDVLVIKSNTTTTKTYSKYLSDKQKAANVKNVPEKNKRDRDETPPIDNIMKHFISSRMSNVDKSDESISEEIMQAYDSSEKNVNSPDSSVESNISPQHNLLDETIPESPKTKRKVIDQINNLKQQSINATNTKTNNKSHSKLNPVPNFKTEVIDKVINFDTNGHNKIFTRNKENEKNKLDKDVTIGDKPVVKTNLSSLSDLPSLVMNKNTKILPSYVNKGGTERMKKTVIVENINGQEISIKEWSDS